jgi:transposase
MPIVIAPALPVTDEQRRALEVMARSTSLPHRKVVQAKALLLAGDGVSNEDIARRCDTTPDTVRRWRARFAESGVAGVGVIAAGRGRKPSVPAEVHKHADVKQWLDHPKRARFHLHFTPTSASWLNLVERWFKELTDKRLRRGVFTSVKDLTEAIQVWVKHWNDHPRPFVWHKTAAEIIAKVKRGRATQPPRQSATDH